MLCKDVIMCGDKDLYATVLKGNKEVHQGGNVGWVDVGVGLIPKENGPWRKCAVFNKQPQQGNLADSFGNKVKFKL